MQDEDGSEVLRASKSILNNYRTERPNGIPADLSKGREDDRSIELPHHSLLVHKARDSLGVLEHLTHASEPATIGNAKAGRPVFTLHESTFQHSQSLAPCLPPPHSPLRPASPRSPHPRGCSHRHSQEEQDGSCHSSTHVPGTLKL